LIEPRETIENKGDSAPNKIPESQGIRNCSARSVPQTGANILTPPIRKIFVSLIRRHFTAMLLADSSCSFLSFSFGLSGFDKRQ